MSNWNELVKLVAAISGNEFDPVGNSKSRNLGDFETGMTTEKVSTPLQLRSCEPKRIIKKQLLTFIGLLT